MGNTPRAHRQSEAATDALVLCAWCVRSGGASVAARSSTSAEWQVIAPTRARQLHQDPTTSHGVCSSCLSRITAEWERVVAALASPLPAGAGVSARRTA